MKAGITGRLQHMADGDLLRMIPPDTLARIKASDPSPVFRAYAIAHEGSANGNIVGLGQRVVRYFREVITKLHNRMAHGTPIFHRHAASNSHDGRAKIGELVGKQLQDVHGVLTDIAAVYVYPQYRDLPLDIASIEAEVEMTQAENGDLAAIDVGEITGIALSHSTVERPGFPGATLLAAVQAFAGEGGTKPMTLEEIIAAIKAGGHKPSQVFDKATLEGDSTVTEIVKTAKQTEYEHAKRIEKKLAEEREDFQKKEAQAAKELETLQSQVTVGKSRSTFDALVTERKLTPQQKAFAEKKLAEFKSEAKDESALKTELNTFLDDQIKAYGEYAALFGVKPETKPNDDGTPPNPPADTTTTEDSTLADPKANDFIP